MNKRGPKPFVFTPEILAEIELMAGQGLNQEQIATNLGIGANTLSTKKGQIKELEEAIKRGRASAINQVTSKLFENCMDGKETSIFFFLCNRDRDNWKHVSKAGEEKNSENTDLVAAISQLIAKMPG